MNKIITLLLLFVTIAFAGRYYDSDVGIWVSTDPDAQFFNAYSYTGGNPINMVDPNGRSAWETFDGSYEVIPDGDNNVYSWDPNANNFYINTNLSGPLAVSLDIKPIDKFPATGHAFISLHQGKVSQTIGNYPDRMFASGGPSRVYFNDPRDVPSASYYYYGTQQQVLSFAQNIKTNATNFGVMPYWFLGPNSNSFAGTMWRSSGGSYLPNELNTILPGFQVDVSQYMYGRFKP